MDESEANTVNDCLSCLVDSNIIMLEVSKVNQASNFNNLGSTRRRVSASFHLRQLRVFLVRLIRSGQNISIAQDVARAKRHDHELEPDEKNFPQAQLE